MGDKGILIYVAVKHVGNVGKKVKEHPLLLQKTPVTFRDLIAEAARSCIFAYRERADKAKTPEPLTSEQLEGMAEVGKLAFGVHYNENKIDEEKAVQAAIDAVADGLVRVFKGSDELTDLYAEIKIAEGDVFTFVRLTMLSGRMW